MQSPYLMLASIAVPTAEPDSGILAVAPLSPLTSLAKFLKPIHQGAEHDDWYPKGNESGNLSSRRLLAIRTVGATQGIGRCRSDHAGRFPGRCQGQRLEPQRMGH